MYKRLISAVVLVAYSALLIKVMVLKELPMVRIGHLMLNFGGVDAGHGPNFVPFATILPYLMGHKGFIIAGINLVGNIILLVPLGFLAPLVYRGMTWKMSLALAAASGLAIECMQVVLKVGIFDIDDVILNALGFMIGYWAYLVLAKLLRSKNGTLIAGVGIAVVVVAAPFLYQKYPVSLEAAPNNDQAGMGTGQGRDLCGGTGGNGQMVRMSSSTLSMLRRDGITQTIYLSDKTEIKTNPGVVLKVGDRITLVGDQNSDGNFTAEAVFVCSAS